MQVPGIGLVGTLPAVTVAGLVAEVLSAPLPQPDLVMIYVSTSHVSFQFSATGSGDARFGYVHEWASHYSVQVSRFDRFHETVFSYKGIEFKAYAAEPEDGQ